MLCGILGAAIVTRPGPQASVASTALLQVITLPSETPTVAAPTPAAETAPTELLPSAPGNIVLEAYVQVIGTGGDGLRMRSSPSLDGDIQFLGLESEVLQVKDGPRQADGYTWWFLVAPYDPQVKGWAVANYLQVVQNP